MKRPRRKLHYKTKLSITLCGIVLVPVTMIVILYNVFFAGYNRQTQLERCDLWLADSVSRVREIVENVLKEVGRFESEEGQMDFLYNPAQYSLADKIDIFRTNRNILLAIAQQGNPEVVESIKVYGQYILPEMITPGPMYPMDMLRAENPDVLEVMETTGQKYLYHIEQCFGNGEPEPVGPQKLIVYRAVRDVKGKLVTVDKVVFSFSALMSAVSEFPFDNCFLIYEGVNGAKILLGLEDEELCGRVYREFIDGGRAERVGKYIVRNLELMYSSEMNEGGREDHIYLFIPRNKINERENTFFRNILLITGIIILLISGVIQIVTRILTKELYQLLNDIRLDYPNMLVEKEQPEINKVDEFDWIRRKFNDIIAEISDYSDKVMRAEYEQRVLKAELMQDLISPHFLYNTLDGLRWSTDDPNLIKVIEDMVNFYRLALNKGESFTTMGRELEMARSYLEVQAFAYESQFRYEIDVPETLAETPVLKHILQPFLENSLVHGIDKREDRGYIRICAWQKDSLLQIEILDNGAGMSEEKISQLIGGSSNSGYGIHNVIQRITLFYGEEYGIKITSVLEKGTRVLVTLPVQNDKGVRAAVKGEEK